MTPVRIQHRIVISMPGYNLTLNHDSGSEFNVEYRPWVIILRRIKTGSHNSTWNHDPGSKFNVESWPGTQFNVESLPGVKFQCWIITRGHNSTWGRNYVLNYDFGSEFHIELWSKSRVTIKRWIKTRDQNSTWNQELGSQFNGGPHFIHWRGRNTMTPVSGVAIQHEKSVDFWAQLVESRPNGSKFSEVKTQFYTGNICSWKIIRLSLKLL